MKKIRISLLAISALMIFNACKKDDCSNPGPENPHNPTERTLTLQPADGKDAMVFDCQVCGYDIRNFASVQEFSAISTTNMGSVSNGRALIHFDLSSIPAGSKIKSAKLSLYHETSPSNGDHRNISGPNICILQKITSDWQESTVTWVNQPSISEIDQVFLPESTSNTQDYVDIDVLNLIKDMVKNPANNFGLMLKLQEESPYRQLIFASSDNPNASKRPKLVVKYVKK